MSRRYCVAAVAVAVALCVGLTQAAGTVGPTDYNSFLGWFQEKGGIANKVTLAEFPGMGTGVQATDPVNDGDTVLTVPLKLIMCRDTLKKEPEGALYDAIPDDAAMIAVALMYHRALGHKSKWAAYVQILPANVPIPATFTAAELELLQDARLVTKAKDHRADLERSYQSAPVVAALDKLFGQLTEQAQQTYRSFDMFLWAQSLIGSRALTLRGKRYLVPFADMYNYEPQSVIRSADNGAHFLKYHVLGTNDFKAVADRKCAPGNQLFEDYGDNDNELYLFHHGFVANDNPFDCVRVKLRSVIGTDSISQRRRALMKALNLSPTHEHCVSAAEFRDRRLLAYLKVSNMNDKQLTACDPVVKGYKDPKSIELCLGGGLSGAEAYDTESMVMLGGALKKQMKAFPTTIEEDTALLADKASDLSEAGQLAVAARLQRKKTMQKLIDFIANAFGPVPEPKTPAPPQPVDPRPDSDVLAAKVKAFNQWFREGKPSANYLAAKVFPGELRVGCVATQDIAAEDIYLGVPTRLLMDRNSARESVMLKPIWQDLDQRYPKGDPVHEMLVHLIFERFVVGAKSFWAPYIDLLPTAAELDFPVYWTQQELNELNGTYVLPSILTYRERMKQRFNAVKSAVFNVYAAVLPLDVYNFENYQWAMAILDSRSIWWNSERHLVPMLDLLNCKEGPDPKRVHSTVLDASGKFAVTKAPWAFAKGEQVYENYGQPNYIYFMYHGFSLLENTHDCAPLYLLTPNVPDREGRIKKLESRGYAQGAVSTCVKPGEVDDELMEFLNVAHGVTSKPHAFIVLASEAEQKLAAFTTTVEDDMRLLENTSMPYRRKAAIQLRMLEKKMLKRVVDFPLKKEQEL